MNAFSEHIKKQDIVLCFILAISLNLLLEILSRFSLVSTLVYIFTSGHMFWYNVLFLFATLSLSQLSRRKTFTLTLIGVFWLLLGATNCIILLFRNTPFSATDLLITRSALTLLDRYLSLFSLILIGLALFLILSAIFYLFFRDKPKKIDVKKALMQVGVTLSAFAALTAGFLFFGLTPSGEKDITTNYKECGFPYCFFYSLFREGVQRPELYTQDAMASLSEELEEESSGVVRTPNIVYLQLESFFDVQYLEGVTFSEPVQPVFTDLKKNCPSGFLGVPSLGGGTANTEFEILTGMSMNYFGLGEYPYKTVLQDHTCESIAYNLSRFGYTNHALHDYTATFYDRNLVFSHLGFDTFTSLEYMQNVSFNSLGWAEDMVLIRETMNAMQSTKGQDFVFNISVQGHGRYPVTPPVQPHIRMEGLLLSQEEQNRWVYYINEMHRVDAFIGAMISALSAYNEPVVLVMYGDHLPALPIEAEQLSNQSLFQSEYVIWCNPVYARQAGKTFLKLEDRDLEAYQLSAYVMEALDMHEGILTRFHQQFHDSKNYQTQLEMLEYDMLYGERTVYEGLSLYEKTELQMGLNQPKVQSVTPLGGQLYLSGVNFTPYCKVKWEDMMLDTLYINDKLLLVVQDLPGHTAGETVELKMVVLSQDEQELGETQTISCKIPQDWAEE